MIDQVDNLIMGNDKVYVNLHQESSEEINKTKKVESGECPICGRAISRQNSLRCKRYGREFICLKHQNPENFLCSECVKELVEIQEEQVREAMSQKIPKVKDTLSHIFFMVMLLFCTTGLALIILDIRQSLDYLA